MPELTWASIGAALLSIITTVFNGIVSTLKASWEASHKWFAVGCIIFVALVWFGFAHLPTFSAKDSALEKQVAELSKKLDMLSSDINGVSIKVDTLKDMGGVPAKKSRK
jgi:hypothetical protein